MNRQYSDNLRDFLYWCYRLVYVGGPRDLQNVTEVINRIVNEPIPNHTKEESKEILKSVGIFDDKGDIAEEFKPYITKLEDNNE